jgi:PiT family inorganic phosphate transporter
MVDYMDMTVEMMWVVIIMLAVFIIAYIYYMLVHGKKQTALKESNMYKRLQLLSSAAFSLGHGGADSQKVMGIICAALMVYGSMHREGKITGEIDSNFKISEVMNIKYYSQDGKLQKYKPKVGNYNGIKFYEFNHTIFDANSNETIFSNNQLNTRYSQYKKIKSIGNEGDAHSKLKKLHVYAKGDSIFDAQSDQVVFSGKKFEPAYANYGVFHPFITNKHFASTMEVSTKVNHETMPSWISIGCYLMIALGTLFGGWKIVKTMGTKITKVSALEGVTAETAGALTLFVVSNLGIPVSTTHTITGSIIGVGATKRLSAVRWGVTINLLWAWILTIPVSATLAIWIYYIICFFK